MKFKVGDKVRVLNIGSTHGLKVGDIRIIDIADKSMYRLGAPITWVYADDIESVEPLEPVVTKVKPSNSMKPRIKTFASGKRQFDVEFKLMIIRTANSYAGTRTGSVTALLKKYSLDKSQLKYWRKQFNQGHFTANRAVAFSRKDTMIHG